MGSPAESHGLTGPLNRKAALRHQMGEDILERRILQRKVGLHLLEAAVLVFEFLQPLHIGGLQSPLLWRSTCSRWRS